MIPIVDVYMFLAGLLLVFSLVLYAIAKLWSADMSEDDTPQSSESGKRKVI
jgi:hypothetical protein